MAERGPIKGPHILHGPYVNQVYTQAKNTVTGTVIDITGACNHEKWARDWGDGSGYEGMQCRTCSAFASANEESFYN